MNTTKGVKTMTNFTLKNTFEKKEEGININFSKRGDILASFNESNPRMFFDKEEAQRFVKRILEAKFNYNSNRDDTLITKESMLVEIEEELENGDFSSDTYSLEEFLKL